MMHSPFLWVLASSHVVAIGLALSLHAFLGWRALAISVPLCLVLPYLLSRVLTARLGALGAAVEAVTHGKTTPSLPPPQRDEIGQLGAVIGELAQRFEEERSQHSEDQQELQQAREAVRAAGQSRSDFLAIMSHEIRTPLNGIMGMTQLAAQTALTDEQREYLQIVQASADFLLSIFNDLQDFARTDSGILQLESVAFALRDTVDDTIRMLALRAQQKGLELVSDIAPDAWDALAGDPDRLRQLLANLLANAINFTEVGEVVIRVTQEAHAGDQVRLHFQVSDTGIGIPPEKQAILLGQTLLDDTAGPQSGAGLGMVLARQGIERMGGRLWIESEMGHGSTFHFTLSFKTRAAEPVALPSLSGVNVLALDDNATTRQVIEKWFKHWNVTCQTRPSAAAALTALEQGHGDAKLPSLLIVDATLPDIDGFQFVERVRQKPGLAQTPILMMIPGHQPELAARCRELGVAGHVMKPLKQSEVILAMGRALRLNEALPKLSDTPVSRSSGVAATPPLRVLLAEGNPLNRQLAVVLLEKLGHHVTLASTGQEVLSLLEQRPVDLVIMDLQLPELDGFQTTAAIRANEKATGRRLPIVALIGYGMTHERDRCRESGMDSFITKPLQIQELIQVLKSVASTRPIGN